MAQNELKRFLFNTFDRLEEAFRYRDPSKTGFVTKNDAYTILRGANLPLDKDLLYALLDRVVNENCKVDYCKLIEFLNYKKYPAPSLQPKSIRANVGYAARNLSPPVSDTIQCVNLEKLVRDIDLEKNLLENN